jgi:hypothetical protein
MSADGLRRHDVVVLRGAGHDVSIERLGIAGKSASGPKRHWREEFDPTRDRIHVDQQLHALASSICLSSASHAAYRSACRILAFGMGLVGQQFIDGPARADLAEFSAHASA